MLTREMKAGGDERERGRWSDGLLLRVSGVCGAEESVHASGGGLALTMSWIHSDPSVAPIPNSTIPSFSASIT